jgi:hypothetical protein
MCLEVWMGSYCMGSPQPWNSPTIQKDENEILVNALELLRYV